jgi:hypothetical protein
VRRRTITSSRFARTRRSNSTGGSQRQLIPVRGRDTTVQLIHDVALVDDVARRDHDPPDHLKRPIDRLVM